MKRFQSKGFTLAELLVVVAIIGVLVAVSIPIFSSQTTKAKAATDMANVRAAKVAAIAQYMNDGASGVKTYYYDAASGTVTDNKTKAASFDGYGKSSVKVDGADGIPNDGTPTIVTVECNEDGSTTETWGFKTNSVVAKEVYQSVFSSFKSSLSKSTTLYSNKMSSAQADQYAALLKTLSAEDQEFLNTHIWYMTNDSKGRLRVFFTSTTEYKSGNCLVYKYDLSDTDKTKEGKYQVSYIELSQVDGNVLNAGSNIKDLKWGYYDSNHNWIDNGWTDSYE